MDVLESELKTFCFSAPRWMQLELQGFWYGLVSTVLTYKEENQPITLTSDLVEKMLVHADPEFTDWPTSWLEPIAKQFLELDLSIDDLNIWFECLESAFRDSVPTDLNIFTTYSNGGLAFMTHLHFFRHRFRKNDQVIIKKHVMFMEDELLHPYETVKHLLENIHTTLLLN